MIAWTGSAWATDITSADLSTSADVVILGEIHDNPAHHLFQAEAIRSLDPSAVVFEMFGPDGAEALAGVDLTDAAAVDQALGWEDSGWPEFGMYAPIFEALGDAAIFGGARPRDDVRRAMSEGAAQVFGDGAESLGLDRPLPEDEQAAREAEQMAAHCDALPAEMLPGMVQAQRLRDAALADTILRALDATGGTVAVITGNGHARRDWGIPTYLSAARAELAITTVGQFEAEPQGDVPFDHWRVTAPAEREDPCAAFR
jgi:uncharacterized iron-regulated protein